MASYPPPRLDVIDRQNSTHAADQHPKDHNDVQVAINAILDVLGNTPWGQSGSLTAELARLQAAITAGGGGGGGGGSTTVLQHYVHSQTFSASTWLVQHNLGYDPVIEVISSDGMHILGFDLTYADDHNSLTLGFSQAITGRALLSN